MTTDKLYRELSMTKILSLIAFASLLFFASCSTDKKRNVASQELSQQARLKGVTSLLNKSQEWRAQSAKLISYLDNKVEQKKVLTGADINNLIDTIENYLQIYQQLMEFSSEDRAIVSDRKNFTTDFRGEEGQAYLMHLKMVLAVEAIAYDNYLYILYPLKNNSKLRRLVVFDNTRVAAPLKEMTDEFWGTSNTELLATSLLLYRSEHEQLHNKTLNYEAQYLKTFKTLTSYFENSLTHSYLTQDSLSSIPQGKNLTARMDDLLHEKGEFLTYITSKFFGNTVGAFASRKGKLINMSPEEQESVTRALKPLDILLERTPFRLTAKFIPGYYGHVALWVGTEEELKELGIWNHPAVQPHQDAVRQKRLIVEALRPGVQINSFEHFLNIDDLLVMRQENLNLDQKRRYLITAFRQIGKKYDFNFDVETDDTIVCSELAYTVYEDIHWPLEKQLGRYAITPDHVASMATDPSLFRPIIMYKDGMRVPTQIKETLQKALTAE